MNDFLKKEQKKYDYLHSLSGFEKNQDGYGRQRDLLINSNDLFFLDLRNNLVKDKILEIGVGAGEISTWLIENYKFTRSIDISEYAINQLKKILNNQESLVFCSANSLPFKDETFNTVIHLDGMEHIPQELELDCLKEAVRVSNYQGKIYYANACCDAWWDQHLTSAGFDPAHINIKTPELWKEFYFNHSNELNYKIIYEETINETYYIILEKK